MIDKAFLVNEYLNNRLSAKQIAKIIKCSENTVHYWLEKYKIKKRSIKDAVYTRSNPNGNPFTFSAPISSEAWFLYGLGLGLYWGEGNKANTQAVRIGNVDADLLRMFLEFLKKIYHIDPKRLRFGLQIFSDCSPIKARNYWCRKLDLDASQFHKKIIVTKSTKPGTYKKKSQYGVLTVYFSNIKLRDMILAAIDDLRVVNK